MNTDIERKRRYRDRDLSFSDIKSRLFTFIEQKTKITLRSELKNFVDKIAELGSKHDGLSAQQYFGHPVRVAELSLSFYEGTDPYKVLRLALVPKLI